MPGFQSAIVDNITLTAGATVRVDVRLQVGGVTQTVEVQSQNAQIQTEDAKISTAVSNTLVDQLPLVVGGAMRSPFDLVATVPEAKNGTNLALGGGQGGAFAATFDGVSVNTNRQGNTTETSYLTPSVEAITEFAVDTNGFKAEYGQAGGGVISFASKSGTNELHGSAYDFIRNDYVDARGFFAPTKGVYRQNDFGGSLGGPVWIPEALQRQEPHLLLRGIRGLPQSAGQPGQYLQRADAGDVPGRLLQLGEQQEPVDPDLRYGHHAGQSQRLRLHPRSLPRQHHSGAAVQHGLQPVHRAREVRAGAQSSRHRARAPSATSARTTFRAAAARRNPPPSSA